jgi:hypothetical protein
LDPPRERGEEVMGDVLLRGDDVVNTKGAETAFKDKGGTFRFNETGDGGCVAAVVTVAVVVVVVVVVVVEEEGIGIESDGGDEEIFSGEDTTVDFCVSLIGVDLTKERDE